MEHAAPEAFWVDKTKCSHADENGRIQNPTLNPCAEGISAVKAIAIAQAEGQKIYTINKANAQTALAKLPIGGEVGSEIRNAVNAGKEVTVHEKSINKHGWKGFRYIVIDPETGAGAYLIEGSGNGAILMLIGVIYMMAALILFITIGASTGGLGLIAAGTGLIAFANFLIAGISIYMAGLMLATGNKRMCAAFMSVYAGASLSMLALSFNVLGMAMGQAAGNFFSGFAFSDHCS